jgi:serine/threonine-protein kinase
VVKIIDFGVVAVPISELTRSNHAVGTPLYMAPESFATSRVDYRADIYSLGVIAYELFAGRLPVNGKNIMAIMDAIRSRDVIRPRKLNIQIPVLINDLILKMLARDVDQRLDDIQAVIDLCRAYTSSDVMKTIAINPPPSLRK